MDDPLLTDVEVAALLRKHPRTIRRWCQADQLPGAHKAGRSWRVPRSSLPGPTPEEVDTARAALKGTRPDIPAAVATLRRAAQLCDDLAAELGGYAPRSAVARDQLRALAEAAAGLRKSITAVGQRAAQASSIPTT
jgi:hypothetical protein